MASRALWDHAFVLWVAIGLFWATLTVFCGWRCSNLPPVERTFRFVTPDPETQARYDEYDRWVPRLLALARGSLAYALIGVVMFFRRGCVALALAAGLVVISGCVWLNTMWVPL